MIPKGTLLAQRRRGEEGIMGRGDRVGGFKKKFNLKKERKRKKPFFSWSSEQALQDLP